MRFMCLVVFTFCLVAPASAAVVTVPVTNPDPTGSNGLEEAINTVKAGDPDDIYIIEIALEGDERTISINTELPVITQRAVIVRGTRTRQEGLYIITGRNAKNRDAGTLLRMRPAAGDPGDSLLYSIENLILESSGFQCARMTANSVSVVNSVFRECLQPGTGLSALFIDGSGSIRDSDFIGNRSACGLGNCRGGAITAKGGRLIIDSSFFGQNRIRGEREPSFGGAIAAMDGIDISDSYFYDNSATNDADDSTPFPIIANGGAVYVEGAALIYRSSFRLNESNGGDQGSSFGGAVFQVPSGSGSDLLMRVWNVEFDDNRSVGNGSRAGALMQTSAENETPRLDVRNSTFLNNRASDVGADLVIESDQAVEEIYNTIFASSDGTPSCLKGGGSGTLNGEWNLLTTASNCNLAGITTDNVRFGGLRQLGRLRVNNLLPDSPAIDQGSPLASDFGNPSTCRPTDIIGTERPRAGPGPSERFCDIGALEFVEDRLFGDRFQQ